MIWEQVAWNKQQKKKIDEEIAESGHGRVSNVSTHPFQMLVDKYNVSNPLISYMYKIYVLEPCS